MATDGDDGVQAESARELQDDLERAKERLGDARQNLKSAVRDVRTARQRLRGSAGHDGRNAMLFLVGIALVVLFNPATGPSTRRWLSGRRG